MTVLALIIGLGVEVGWWYALQRQNQSAADAAALSAAYEYAHSNLTLTPAQLTPFATAAANRNKYAGDTPIVTFPGAGQVQAVLNRSQGSWFSKLAGPTNVTIQTGAIAQVNGTGAGLPNSSEPERAERNICSRKRHHIGARLHAHIQFDEPQLGISARQRRQHNGGDGYYGRRCQRPCQHEHIQCNISGADRRCNLRRSVCKHSDPFGLNCRHADDGVCLQ